jgi:hemolysin activation/secretion protein
LSVVAFGLALAQLPAGVANAQLALTVIPAGGQQEQAVRDALASTLQAEPPQTLAEVEQWSARLTAALRQGGFSVGQVLMTGEDWEAAQKTGKAVFTAFPGRVSRITVENTSQVKDNRLQRLVTSALCGRPTLDAAGICLFETRRFERTTQLLQDLPGASLDGAPRFGPGAATGDIEAAFVIAPKGKPVSLDAMVDDSGMAVTGRTRFTALARANNLFGLGEDYAVSTTVTTKGMWSGSLAASTPVFSDGLRLAGGFTRQQYTVNAAATTFAGTVNTGSVGLTYPFTRGLDSNVTGGASYLHSASAIDYTDFGYSTHGKIDALKLSLNANNGDRAQQLRTNLWNAGMALTLGRQSNDDPLDAGPRRAGTYAKLSGSVFGRLTLDRSGDWFATAGLDGQLSSRNLDASEQLPLGGPNAVRAYRADEGQADEGAILNLGFYKRFPVAEGHQLQIGPIMDFAIARVNAHPWDGWESAYVGIPNVRGTRKLAGYGVEAAWLTPFGFTLSASASKPFNFSDGSWIEPDQQPVQYWMSLSWGR